MLGRHIVIDVWGANPSVLQSLPTIQRILKEACVYAGATVLQVGGHKFDPMPGNTVAGVTAFALLSESHASIHTYPEIGVWMADVFTCGETVNPADAAGYLVLYLGGHVGRRDIFPRGDYLGPSRG